MAKARSTPQAVALRYQPDQEPAPKITAKGSGYIAERIIKLAKTHGVPVREDKNLVQVLSLLDLNEEIPTSVYKAVAEIVLFLFSRRAGASGAAG